MRWLLFIGLAWASDPSLEVHTITMEELDALARQTSWSEMVFRLKEVPAADRNPRWEALVEKAALGQLDILSAQGGSQLGTLATSLLAEYPSLRRSRKYLDKRIEVTFAALRKCYENPFIDDECGARLLTFVQGEPRDLALVRRAAGLVAEKESHEAVLPFLKHALIKNSRDKICRDEFWQNAVLAGLDSAEEGPRKEAKEIASRDCWPQLKAPLLAELARKPNSVRAICDLLKEKKILTSDRAKLCPVPAPEPTPTPAKASEN